MSDDYGRPLSAEWDALRVAENRALTERIRLVMATFPRDREVPWLAPEPVGGRLSDTGEEG